jgi:hypothetical protein
MSGIWYEQREDSGSYVLYSLPAELARLRNLDHGYDLTPNYAIGHAGRPGVGLSRPTTPSPTADRERRLPHQ